MKTYPILLLLLRLIHRWCHVTGLSRNRAGAGNTSNILTSMLLAQCMRKGHVQNFNEDHITTKRLQIMQGEVTDGDAYMQWEELIRSLEKSTTENPNDPHYPQAEMITSQLGEILMEFFQTHETSFERKVPDPLASILRMRKFAESLDKEHLDLVKEHMHRAYQLLALYGDTQIMLAISGSEDYHVIFLSPLMSSFVAGVKRSKAQEIAKKTGARSVVIRESFPRSRSSAFLEVKGSEPAIRAVEKELEKMAVQASRDRVSLMSGCFVEGASLLLFEGSRNENDHVTLTPYDGPCHQTHDSLARHVALVISPTCNEYPQRRFTEKFFQQLKVLHLLPYFRFFWSCKLHVTIFMK